MCWISVQHCYSGQQSIHSLTHTHTDTHSLTEASLMKLTVDWSDSLTTTAVSRFSSSRAVKPNSSFCPGYPDTWRERGMGNGGKKKISGLPVYKQLYLLVGIPFNSQSL